jgi:hypothetical protein
VLEQLPQVLVSRITGQVRSSTHLSKWACGEVKRRMSEAPLVISNLLKSLSG